MGTPAAPLAANPLGAADTLAALSQRCGLPVMTEGDWPQRLSLPDGISPGFLRANLMLPLGASPSGRPIVALCDPDNWTAMAALRKALGAEPDFRLASPAALIGRLETLAGPGIGLATGDTTLSGPEEQAPGDEDAPLVALLDDMLAQAVEARASDLHFEPGPRDYSIRQRVDGLLRPVTRVSQTAGRGLVSRLKILAGLNIAERRLPQDGNIRISVRGDTRDLRCATMPMVNGEGATLRILAARRDLPSLGTLGLGARDRDLLEAALASPQGLVLVTGPTGSGKTTTLAAAMGHLNSTSVKLMSVEDPVEYAIAGVSQVQVNPAAGLDFARALRSLLRADPDIIAVGEIRDGETARIAVQAALTGHLVLSTLHTNSAAAALPRLIDMGLEPFLLAATLKLVVGQRLVRRLCPHCAGETRAVLPVSPALAARLGIPPLMPVAVREPVGCGECGQTGYFGRRALVETLPVSAAVRSAIAAGATSAEIDSIAVAEGMVGLAEAGFRAVLGGETGIAEVLRVIDHG